MTVRAYLTHENDRETAGIETPETWEDLMENKDY